MTTPTNPESRKAETGEGLFKFWSGNSYEWDALSDIEHQRWNRLAEKWHSRIATLEGERTWQPISTAPKNGVVVLTMHRNDIYPVAAYMSGPQWRRVFEGPEDVPADGKDEVLFRDPTHWMPLPVQPDNGEKGQG